MIDRLSVGIQLEARVVGDAREVDHRIARPASALEERPVPDVPSYRLQRRVRGQDVVAEEKEIDDPNVITGGQELRDQHGPDVARPASDEDSPAMTCHVTTSGRRNFCTWIDHHEGADRPQRSQEIGGHGLGFAVRAVLMGRGHLDARWIRRRRVTSIW